MFVLSFGLTASCSSDDNASGGTASGIVGKWNMTHIGVLMEDGEEMLIPVPQLCPGKNFSVVEFAGNGSFRNEQYDEDCDLDVTTGTYSISGEFLTIHEAGDEPETVIIKELTSSTLKVYAEDEEDDMLGIVVFSRL